ncbi:hypothetical protein ERC79_11265 [Rhodococcus sp. ABRD24]|nr:hypothetical protein ERC79_11265 [Rhodococcus sp. ABRD24]
MHRRFLSAFVASIFLAFPMTAGAAPLTGSLGSGSFDSGSLSGSLGSSGFWGSLAPDENQTYEELDPTSGTLIATNGFQVGRDGFKFENWSDPTPEHPRGLTPQSMQTLYGDEICARVVNGECALTATGQALQADLDDFLSGGHCYGFATASGLFATGVVVKGDYLGPGTTVFENDPTDRLDGLISRYAVTQFSSPTTDGTTKNSVSETLGKLRAAWARGDDYVLGVYGEPGGHALTPIALRDLGKGKTGIVVYDNNFPGVEKMVVTDPGANTWYYTAMLNPSTPAYLFVGSPENRMDLAELKPSTQVQECPTCVDGDASVLVLVKDNSTNADGTVVDSDFEVQRPGGGDVPGLEVRPLLNNTRAALLSVPAATAFEINLVGATAGATADFDISLYGEGWFNEMDSIALRPGDSATVSVDQSQRKLSLTGSTVLEPETLFAAEQADWSVSTKSRGLRLQPGSTLSVERDANGDLVYGLVGGAESGSLLMGVKRTDAVGDRVVKTNGPVALPAGAEASVPVNVWDGVSPLAVRVLGVGVDVLYPMNS